MRVIINADDFGYNKDVNKSIKKAIENNKISSTTIMANAPCFEEAIQIAKSFSNISYGVHLNIIEFLPLTNSEVFHKYHIVDENGMFVEGAVLCIKRFSEELKRSIKSEWRAQIRKVMETGLEISHLDSHQHTHTIPELQEILLDLMVEFGISKCRRRMYISIPQAYRNRGYRLVQYDKTHVVQRPPRSLFHRVLRRLIILPFNQFRWLQNMKGKVSLTDAIFTYQNFVQDVDFQKNRMEHKTVELECHPGLFPNTEETEMVMDDKLRSYIPSFKLIKYSEL